LSAALPTIVKGQSTSRPLPTIRQDNDIREAVIRYLAKDWAGQELVFFISVEGKDPSDEFMSRFKDLSNTVKVFSASKYEDSLIHDKSTGRPGIVFAVEKVTWVTTKKAELDGSYECGGLCAGGSRYRITFDGKKWVVEPGDTIWAS